MREGSLFYSIQILTTSRNTLTDIPRTLSDQISGHTHGPVDKIVTLEKYLQAMLTMLKGTIPLACQIWPTVS
jgi:hypothetical protein